MIYAPGNRFRLFTEGPYRSFLEPWSRWRPLTIMHLFYRLSNMGDLQNIFILDSEQGS